MSSEVWSFVPQAVYEETLTTMVRATALGTRTLITRATTGHAARQFNLQYTIVTSAECQAMTEAYTARQGSDDYFFFINPNDQSVYTVSFDPSITARLFTPIFLQTEPIVLTEVAASEAGG
jgi:hypothetical protein